MDNQVKIGNRDFSKEQKLRSLFFYLSNSKSKSVIAYCVNEALKRDDLKAALEFLKDLQQDNECIIADIYGERVLMILKSL